ncbi:cupredoxin domain-containing protein [Effusibacillus consociatus]|uniref:Cupredoxin domain-containing protein n=1 Tax=Effusibacillus consociatus TaxID=1117041 RepID=A0ABV9Q7T6_9BACL
MLLKQNYARLIFVFFFAVLAVLALYLFKGSFSSAQKKDKDGIHVEIRLKEWEISPRDITVDKGETVHLSIVNQGGYPHDFVIRGLNLKTSTLAPGQKETLTFVAEQSMILETSCTLAGHKEAGMVAKLSIK